MRYFIDTNIFVAAPRSKANGLRSRFVSIDPSKIAVPHQVLAELRVGAAKSARHQHHNACIDAMLRPFAVVWPDTCALEHYADVRVALKRQGLPIGEADLWIAALVRAHNGILVTHNVGEFSRVPGLTVKNWLTA